MCVWRERERDNNIPWSGIELKEKNRGIPGFTKLKR